MIEMSISGDSPLGDRVTRDFLAWLACKLKIDHYKKPIFIDLVFRPNLLKKEHVKGWITVQDSGCRPREFSIEVDSGLSVYLTLETLSHEMIHARQYATGVWQETDNPLLCKWKGEMIALPCLKYEDYPWEVEAYRLESLYAIEYHERNMMTKTEKLLNALQHGQELTTAQIINRFGFVSPSAVTSVVRNLRNEGFAVYANKYANGSVKYRIGTPSRRIIAAGYRALGAVA